MERRPLGLSLGLRTPQLPATHAEAGTVLAHRTRRYVSGISRTSFDEHHCTRATSCRTTMFNHDPEVGVKCIVTRGCLASHAFTAGCLCVA
jgi:hypothetical protein